MKIGILGSGLVGQVLAKGFIDLGHEVLIGTRNPKSESLSEWVKLNPENGKPASYQEAAKFGEILVLATKWEGTENAIMLCGEENFKDKIVLDITNPLKMEDGKASLAVGHTNSGGEMVQKWLPNSKVVKTLNLIGNGLMVNPKFEQGEPLMFLCGNDLLAKSKTIEILKAFGWKEIVDLGEIHESRLMEPLCILWVKYGLISQNWKHAFAILTK